MSAERVSQSPQLSVAILARDAEEPLRETLTSLGSIFAEVVVLDTGSTDGTRGIAEQSGATLCEQPWNDDFSAARNYLRQQCHGEWILWLDAGETLSRQDLADLQQFVTEEAAPNTAYALLVHVERNRQNISAEQAARIRLVPNHPELVFQGRVREQLDLAIEALGLRIEGLPWRIRRGGREHQADMIVRRARRNLRLAELELAERRPTARLLNCVAEARQSLGDVEGAAETYRQALELSQRESADRLEAYYGVLTCLDGGDEKHQSQLSVCLEALEEFPLDAQLLCAMGGYLQSQGRFDLATRSYRTAFQYGRISPEIWHLDEINDIAATSCSRALELAGKPDAAIEILQEAIESSPTSNRIRRRLVEALIQQGAREEALEQLQQFDTSPQQRDLLRAVVRGGCLAQEQNWIAARAHLQTAYDAGCQDSLCLRWYGLTLLGLGNNVEATEIFRQWAELSPAEAEPRHILAAMEQSETSAPISGPVNAERIRVDAPASAPLPGPVTAVPSPVTAADQ